MAAILRKRNEKKFLGKVKNKSENYDGLLEEGEDFMSSSLQLQIDAKSEENLDSQAVDAGAIQEGLIEEEERIVSGTGIITFDVVSAEKVQEGKSSYVKYTIVVNGVNRVQLMPGMVEKRYSDFQSMHTHLRKLFPKHLEEVVFPKKQLLGNFKNETIAKRSRIFEQYLSHLFSINEIRFSKVFREFFYLQDMTEAKEFLVKGDNEEAAARLEKCLPIVEKLMGFWHNDVILVLSGLVLCYHMLNKGEVAIKYANTALKHLQANFDSVYYLPLLHQNIYLHWMMRKNKIHLEEKLAELSRSGRTTEGDFNLKKIVLQNL